MGETVLGEYKVQGDAKKERPAAKMNKDRRTPTYATAPRIAGSGATYKSARFSDALNEMRSRYGPVILSSLRASK